MPRPKRRILTEKPYHVYNRGNYKAAVFETKGAADAFIAALDETVRMFDWRLYAFAIMPNHYHLCVRTPLGNLSEGMHHLLTAFCTRFNRFRKESGHVFQGRFHAKVAPKGISVRRIIDYIHLNPARAGLGTVRRAGAVDFSSIRDYLRPDRRPFVAAAEAYARFIGFTDDAEGRAAYLAELERDLRRDPEDKSFAAEWRNAERAERREARRRSGPLIPERLKGRDEVAAEAAARLSSKLDQLLQMAGLTAHELIHLPKRDARKLAMARELRHAGATYAWIASRLSAGSSGYLRANLRP